MKFIFFEILLCVVGTVVFIGLFQLPFCAELAFFYKGIFYVILTSCIILLLIFLCYKKERSNYFNLKESILILICFICFTIGWFTLLPVTVERSISVYLLTYMKEHEGKAFTLKELEEAFVEGYVKENQAIIKRIYEQKQSGNISEYGNKYSLTKRGKLFVNIFNFSSDLFRTNKGNINKK